MAKQTTWLPYFALAWGIIALTFSSLFVRWAQAPGMVTVFYRMLIASLIFTPIALTQLKKEKHHSWKLLLFPILGGICSALDHATWSQSILQTRVANATLFNNMSPIWVVLFAVVFWHERPKAVFWTGLVLTLAGASAVLGNDLINHPSLSIGDALGVVSSIFYAGYFLFSQKGRKNTQAITFVWIATLVSCIVLFGFTRAMGLPLMGFEPGTWLVFLGAGLLSQASGYFAIVYALGHLPASIVSPSMITQPVITALLAIPFFGEKLVSWQIAGGLLTLLGVYLVNRNQNSGQPSTKRITSR